MTTHSGSRWSKNRESPSTSWVASATATSRLLPRAVACACSSVAKPLKPFNSRRKTKMKKRPQQYAAASKRKTQTPEPKPPEPPTPPTEHRRHRARPTPSWLLEQQDLDEIARRRCLMVLSVLSGETPVTDAITSSNIS